MENICDFIKTSATDPDARQQLAEWLSETVEPQPYRVLNYTTTADIPEATGPVVSSQEKWPAYDDGWMAAFDEFPVSNGLKFQVRMNGGGPSFEARAEGAPAKIYATSGEIHTVRLQCFSSALGLTHEVIQENDPGLVQQQVRQFQRAYGKMRSDTHYGVLNSANLNTTTYSGAGQSEVSGDINTLNTAYSATLTEIADLGMDSMPQAILYAHPTLAPRLTAALGGAPFYTGERVVFPINVVYTRFNWGATTTTMLVIPGHMLVRGELPTLEFPSVQDPSRLTSIDYVHKFQAAAVLGDGVRQIRKVNFA